MSLKNAILATRPTSYWPLNEDAGATSVADACGLHDGTVPASGVTLAAVPFGVSNLPSFDGVEGSGIVIPGNEPKYSHPYSNELTVACWVCPLALDFTDTQGTTDQYVHMIEKAENHITHCEWAFRLLNKASSKPSRMSFYLFNDTTPVCKGAGAYMQHGLSVGDDWEVQVGRWYLLVGQGETWINDTEQCHGAMIYKQNVLAKRPRTGDKYNNPPDWKVKPFHGDGPITIGGSKLGSWFYGGIGHVAIWNRLIDQAEVESIWQAGQNELRATGSEWPE